MKCLLILVGVLCGVQATWLFHCAQRREISPCTCKMIEYSMKQIEIKCERMKDFNQVSEALIGKFPIGTTVTLIVSHSNISDISDYTLKQLGLHIVDLQLTHDNISDMDGYAFQNLTSVNIFRFADNLVLKVPTRVLKHMTNVRTLDLSRGRVKEITTNDFRDIPYLQTLLVAGNEISRIDNGAIPHTVKRLHLGINRLEALNGSIRHLENLEWVFVNNNKLTTLKGELPTRAHNLQMFNAGFNQIQSIPEEFRNYNRLNFLCFNNNNLTALNYTLQKSRRLNRLNLSYNKIRYLAQDEFLEADILEHIDLSHNDIRSLNRSMNSLRSLRTLNLTHNSMEEFSLQEIKGLRSLWVIDLSYNSIAFLSGDTENLVTFETRLLELRLNNNKLTRIGGSLMSLQGLLKLDVSYNNLDTISPDDLIGLDVLRKLDISHNRITSLFELSKTYLPSLDELLASYNNVTILDKDFHGLPVLCTADLSHNQIVAINYDLVSKTRCYIHSVPSALKILLNDNPVLCNENFNDVSAMIQKQHTKISGECQYKPIHSIQPQMNDILSREILGLGRSTLQRGVFVPPKITIPHITMAPLTAKYLSTTIGPFRHPTSDEIIPKEPILLAKESELLEPIPEAVHIQN